MRTLHCDVCVVGGGSGGIGAALGAAKEGASVILVEKNQILGGTVTMSWVHTWEPVCGTSALCRNIWDRMRNLPLGASDADYELSSRRLQPDGQRNPPLPFEAWAFQKAVDELVTEAGVTVVTGTSFSACTGEGRRLTGVIAASAFETIEVKAKAFIDATADIVVARAAGCSYTIGAEARSAYDEPHAPGKADPIALNYVNWCYRVRPGSRLPLIRTHTPFPQEAIRPSRFEVAMPNGDILVNPCGMLVADPSSPEDFAAAVRRAWELAFEVHRWTVEEGGCTDRSLIGLAPEIGIRETYRLQGAYVLTENDILDGRMSYPDLVCSCDHPLDLHGYIHLELERPYGIPLACLETKEYDNLYVASRGASFSHIAASSCRLSRTIMTLGEAAGAAAATLRS
ncbi:MAG: FAD-dependent oxidoreductase [Spirochaetes bacterium]|nr:FAD-dependent oxidoreductase [Spirochaetota bacterium]